MQLTVVVCFVLSISMTVLSAVVGADILVSGKQGEGADGERGGRGEREEGKGFDWEREGACGR
eukprot:1324811-Amorphochlora_amoeboformis.AAC.1